MAADLVCERIAEAAFTGDIVQQIRNRVASSSGLLAVLDDANPNVYLELGYAWGLNKPTILMAKDHIDKKLPFDVQGQKCLLYKSIADLRTKLSHELKALKQQGEFD
jgi:nucleoside 2-deoxyribosyltransferase